MKKYFYLIPLVLALASCQKEKASDNREVYYNAKIYTADANNPEASAIVVEDGKLIYVGSNEKALAMVSADSLKHDMGNKLIIPGLMDTHCHYFGLCNAVSGREMLMLDPHASHEETLQMVKAYANKHSKEETPFIVGMGWGHNVKTLASELDKLGIDRPILLADIDGHTSWANSAVFQAVGVDKNTPDIAPGASGFTRDAQGNPTGRIFEPAQCSWVMQQLGIYGKDDVLAGMPYVDGHYNSLGITTVYDAGGLAINDSLALQAASEAPDHTIRVFASIYYNGLESDDEYIARAKRMRQRYSTDMLRPNTLKAFKDGTTDAGTALVFKPYTPALGKGTGNNMLSSEKILSVTKRAAAEGMNIHVHCIGDRAVSEMLDVMHDLGSISGTKTLAHCELLSGGALEKFYQNTDVVCSTTPAWMTELKLTREYMGDEDYFKYHMPLKSLIDGGITVTFGSDAPTSEVGMYPMNNIWSATCQGIDPSLIDRKEQNLTVAQCIDSYTILAAKQLGVTDELGSLTTGKWADFVVLDQDIFSIPVTEIKHVNVEETYLKGKQVFVKQ
ncbi:MAG: amidohydrolase family protein [Bacteroidales bacterium]|nr:amidohydrolase family protein [Bacteroidales bacterium]